MQDASMDGVVLSVDPALQVGTIGLRDRTQILFDFSQFVGGRVKAHQLLIGDEVECELDSHGLIKRFWVRRKKLPKANGSTRVRSFRRETRAHAQEENRMEKSKNSSKWGIYSPTVAATQEPQVWINTVGKEVEVTLVVGSPDMLASYPYPDGRLVGELRTLVKSASDNEE